MRHAETKICSPSNFNYTCKQMTDLILSYLDNRLSHQPIDG